jgi:hypothetical protein
MREAARGLRGFKFTAIAYKRLLRQELASTNLRVTVGKPAAVEANAKVGVGSEQAAEA